MAGEAGGINVGPDAGDDDEGPARRPESEASDRATTSSAAGTSRDITNSDVGGGCPGEARPTASGAGRDELGNEY